MKILHLTTHLNSGGITSYILELSKQQIACGHEVYVASSGGELEELFHKAGVHLISVPVKTKSILNPILLKAQAMLKNAHQEHGFDIAHAHTRVTQVLSCRLKRSVKLPYVTTCHGFYKPKLGRLLKPAWGEAVIAISDGVGNHLKEDFGVSTGEVHVVYNGMDLEAFDSAIEKHDRDRVRQSWGFNNEDIVLSCVARLIPEKGQRDLIRGFSILLKENSKVRLLLAGEGRDEDGLKALCLELGVESSVVFAGNLEDVTSVYLASDLFAHPARWVEAFGLSFIEAMAARLPILSTDHWALYPLVKDLDIGVFVKKEKPDEIADVLRGLLGHPGQMVLMGQNARKVVEERFTSSRMCEEILKVYKLVLKA